jgi:hypothetical protein
MTSAKTAATLRSELGHPVIDNDGHVLEIVPVLAEFVREVGGADAVERYLAATAISRASTYGKQRAVALEDRRDRWIGQTSFWGHTTNTYDRATSLAPKLFLERMGELGFDFSILYPTEGLYANRLEDPELRRICCRAVNLYQTELFKGCEQQLLPVAVIPMATPEEAIEELEYAVTALGYRTVVLASGSRRPIPAYERELGPDAAAAIRRIDFYGLDAAYDYDPLWQRMVDLKVPATFHGQTVGTWFGPSSISNNTFNRLGAVGYSYPALLLAFLLGGVVRRFPTLKFMFQEGGAGWMSSLFCSLLGVWEKRGGHHIETYNPQRLDMAKLQALVSEYGGDRERNHLDWLADLQVGLVTPEVLDDFREVGAATALEFRDIFVEHFYAGCEADDYTNGFAYSRLPHGAELRTTFGSDIGHWDVTDATECLPEAYELLEHGILTERQLEAFLFGNAYEFYTSTNPDFFVGTTLEKYRPANAR